MTDLMIEKDAVMTDLMVEPAEVWAAPIMDEPGGLAGMLDGLREAGADLGFILARRSSEGPGMGVVFVTPLRGDKEIEAAATMGFNVTSSVAALRVEGRNAAGVAAAIADTIAEASINLRGLSAAVIGLRFIMYLGFDSEEDAAEARLLLEAA